MLPGLRPLWAGFSASRPLAAGRADRAFRGRLPEADRAVARLGRVLARARPGPDARDRTGNPQLATDSHLQEHSARAALRRRQRGKNPDADGREPAQLLRAVSSSPAIARDAKPVRSQASAQPSQGGSQAEMTGGLT